MEVSRNYPQWQLACALFPTFIYPFFLQHILTGAAAAILDHEVMQEMKPIRSKKESKSLGPKDLRKQSHQATPDWPISGFSREEKILSY